MANRQYEPATVFNARIVDMRYLWNPSTEYKGKKQDKPSYFAMFITPKTQAQWFNEPSLAGIATACSKFTGIMQMFNANPQSVGWPVADGDLPSLEGKSSEFAKGHWLFSASTYDNPPNVEIAQSNGTVAKLAAKVGVKSGDHCLVGVTAAVSQNDARKIKLYLNAVVFSSPGEEIVFANSVSGAELMKMAEQQGLRPAGFAGAPQGGFMLPGGATQQLGFAPSTGLGGFAPTQVNPATASPFNSAQGFAPPNPFQR
jgi:hypothetical protein